MSVSGYFLLISNRQPETINQEPGLFDNPGKTHERQSENTGSDK